MAGTFKAQAAPTQKKRKRNRPRNLILVDLKELNEPFRALAKKKNLNRNQLLRQMVAHCLGKPVPKVMEGGRWPK